MKELNALITSDAKKYLENKPKAKLDRKLFEDLFKRYPAIHDNPKFKELRSILIQDNID